MIDEQKVYWSITGDDIVAVAKAAGLPVDLTDEELRVFENCLVEGFSSDWDVVARTAIQVATAGRIGGAASRLQRFVTSGGDTEVLLEGLEP